MKIKEAKTTIDLTGNELEKLLVDKIGEEMGREVKIDKLDITYAYEKKEDGKGYKKTDVIKRVRITL